MFVDHRVLAGRYHGLRRAVHRQVQRQPRGVAAYLIPCRRTGDDAVEVGRIALRARDPLAATLRTAVEVRELRRAAVVRVDHALGGYGHLVDGAIAEVHQLLRMADGELGVVADVAGVGARGRVAVQYRARHRGVRKHAGEAAVADRLELAVPPRSGQPHLDFDVGIAARLQRQHRAAKVGHTRVDRRYRRSRRQACRDEGAPGDDPHAGHRARRNRQSAEGLAGGCGSARSGPDQGPANGNHDTETDAHAVLLLPSSLCLPFAFREREYSPLAAYSPARGTLTRMPLRSIAVCGLGRVGMVAAKLLHESGFQVVGLDVRGQSGPAAFACRAVDLASNRRHRRRAGLLRRGPVVPAVPLEP